MSMLLDDVDLLEHGMDEERSAHLWLRSFSNPFGSGALCGAEDIHARSCPGDVYEGQSCCPCCGIPVCSYCRLLVLT